MDILCITFFPLFIHSFAQHRFTKKLNISDSDMENGIQGPCDVDDQ